MKLKDRGGVDALVNAMVEDEQRRGNKGFGRPQALEEMTAHFVQEVLFADESGTRRALVWLARSDSNMVNKFMNTVEYLIKRGNVRKASDGNTVKTMLIDAEFELINALQERQYLDRNGKTSAFQRSSNTQTETTGDVANARKGRESIDDYDMDRALRKGEMVNEFRDALTKQEWALYYEKVNSTRQLLTDLLRPGDITLLIVNDKLLTLQMQKNGELSVVQAIRALSDDALSLMNDNYSDFEGDYGREKIERWAAAFENDAGTPLFEVYDRQRGRYVPYVNQSNGGEKGTFELSDGESERNRQGSKQENKRNRSEVRGVTEPETIYDVRDIYTGKGEGHSGVMNSRGMTTDEYMALDFSKNKLLQKNGKPYKTLYSGTPYAGFTIFDPGYADDGLSIFATSSKRIAQSYTWEGDNATEYDPRNADRDREQMDIASKYLSVRVQARRQESQ